MGDFVEWGVTPKQRGDLDAAKAPSDGVFGVSKAKRRGGCRPRHPLRRAQAVSAGLLTVEGLRGCHFHPERLSRRLGSSRFIRLICVSSWTESHLTSGNPTFDRVGFVTAGDLMQKANLLEIAQGLSPLELWLFSGNSLP